MHASYPYQHMHMYPIPMTMNTFKLTGPTYFEIDEVTTDVSLSTDMSVLLGSVIPGES